MRERRRDEGHAGNDAMVQGRLHRRIAARVRRARPRVSGSRVERGDGGAPILFNPTLSRAHLTSRSSAAHHTSPGRETTFLARRLGAATAVTSGPCLDALAFGRVAFFYASPTRPSGQELTMAEHSRFDRAEHLPTRATTMGNDARRLVCLWCFRRPSRSVSGSA